MVVDDDKNFCANMKDILSDKDYRVSVTYDVNTAIEKVCEESFDVITLDIKLPPLNGLEIYLSIRDIRPNVVIIMITGYLQEMGKLVEQTLQKGARVLLDQCARGLQDDGPLPAIFAPALELVGSLYLESFRSWR